jgi:hypothetical protein
MAVKRAVPVLIVLFVWSMTTHGKYSASGDEFHYLKVAESLRTDGDLDLENNYRDAEEAGPHVRRNRHGALWSVHDIGVPILLLPVYSAATWAASGVSESTLRRFRQTRGLFAYSILSLALTILTAAAVALLLAGLRRVAAPGYAATVALVLGLSPPVMSHAFLVFPETLAFASVCAAIWLVCLRDEEVTPARLALVVAAIAVLPWLHRKYAFIELGLLLLIARRHWTWLSARPRSSWLALAALALGPQLALHAWTIWAWGQLGGPQLSDGLPFSASGIASGSLGLIFDRERGLLAYAPIYAVAPACLALTWRQSRFLLVPFFLLFLPMASFVVWSAGFSPAARYLVPIMPLLAVPVAQACTSAIVRRVAAVLLVVQAAIVAYAWGHPRALWPKDLGGNEILERIPLIGPAYAWSLPSIATGDSILRAMPALTTLALLTVVVVMLARSRQSPVRSVDVRRNS